MTKIDPIKHCLVCGAILLRKRFSSGVLEDRGRFLIRMTCGKKCQALMQVKTNSKHKQTMLSRARKFKKNYCEECGMIGKLHIHHMDKNILNNNQENLKTLCRKCHDALHTQMRHAAFCSSASSRVRGKEPCANVTESLRG
jgi:hypothetical protein